MKGGETGGFDVIFLKNVGIFDIDIFFYYNSYIFL